MPVSSFGYPAIGGTQEVHASVPKRLLAAGRRFGTEARNRWTLNETGFVTVTFTYRPVTIFMVRG